MRNAYELLPIMLNRKTDRKRNSFPVGGSYTLTLKAQNTTTAEFANTADPDETAHNEPSHLDLQCLPSKVSLFNIKQFLLNVFGKVCRRTCNFVVCFLGVLRLKNGTVNQPSH